MAVYGIKWLQGNRSINDRVLYVPNKWVEVPGNGSYISHSGGLWSANGRGNKYALFECENELTQPYWPIGVRCWGRVRAIEPVENAIFNPIFETCILESPGAAMKYAGHFLTAALLDSCAALSPGVALAFKSADLTPARLDTCAIDSPQFALKHAPGLITAERLDNCAEQFPWVALTYADAFLTPERREACLLAINGTLDSPPKVVIKGKTK